MNFIQHENLAVELANLDRKVNALLPSRYQHCYASVSPTSMGSAGLKYEPDGKVAWEQIWTTFCDLGLAGGPPHRGKLLEPVPEVELTAGLGTLGDVVSEIDRAIGLTTGLPVIPGYETGWVGVRCESTEQATWLQFAVTAENVSARRRQAVLQLPAGPAFRVEKEIKNVVVAVAKAYHYWDGHLTNSQQSLAGDDVWEAAIPGESAANPCEYETVISEVEDGLREAEIRSSPRRYVGWVGIETMSEEQAVWMLRAVLVEQVLARREEKVLYAAVGATPNAVQTTRVVQALSRAWHLWKDSSSRRFA
jgi:hypothetical protein